SSGGPGSASARGKLLATRPRMLDRIKRLNRPAWLRFPTFPGAAYVGDVLLLVGGAVALSAWLNLCYPIPVSEVSHLRVAIEVPVAFALLTIARRVGLRLKWWFFAPLALLALLVRLFLTADNVSHRFIFRDFRVP